MRREPVGSLSGVEGWGHRQPGEQAKHPDRLSELSERDRPDCTTQNTMEDKSMSGRAKRSQAGGQRSHREIAAHSLTHTHTHTHAHTYTMGKEDFRSKRRSSPERSRSSALMVATESLHMPGLLPAPARPPSHSCNPAAAGTSAASSSDSCSSSTSDRRSGSFFNRLPAGAPPAAVRGGEARQQSQNGSQGIESAAKL